MKKSLFLNIRGQLMDLSEPKVMGILNLSPDSFYQKSSKSSVIECLKACTAMLDSGAKIIDLGPMSSRPGAEIITPEESWKRLREPLHALVAEFPSVAFSVDTVYSEVAIKSIDSGAAIINDISAGSIDSAMFQTMADLQVPYVLMHMQGRPENMQENPDYADVTSDLIDFLELKRRQLVEMGVNDIIVDPGFGFGKSLDHNYQILSELEMLPKFLDVPLLVGISRKSMLYKLTDKTAEESLAESIAAHTIALQKGANILRVHDVPEAVSAIKVFCKTLSMS